MANIDKLNEKTKTQRFERFVALSNGQYWRANFTSEEMGISVGQILLISQIDDVDNRPHTIHIRLHPSAIKPFKTTQKFLVDDFLERFEHVESDIAEASRESDLRAIQDKIKDSQDELNNAYSNPSLMNSLIEDELPKPKSDVTALPIKHEALGADIVGAVKSRNLVNLMSKSLTSNGVNQIRSGLEEQRDIAMRRSEWIQMRTNRLTRMANEMTPYFEEKAALQLALSKDMMDHVDELMKGIASLNLYTLKDVDLITLASGPDAPSDIPLTVTQRVLYMDEELAVFDEIDDEFDYRDKHQFFDALAKNKSLISQIFPTERCVVSIATSRAYKDYQSKGYTAFELSYAENANLCQYLLVRNGHNIHVVLSPDVFHQHSKSLFPTTQENEEPFRGWDGKTITYNDLEYTRSLKDHEKIALGYRRLLILLCGLDHNKSLFGDFYLGQPSMEFVSQEFQEKYFNFIHDLDGEGLISTDRPPRINDWIQECNKAITSGCTVLIRAGELFNDETIPAMFSKDGEYQRYEPSKLLKNRYLVCQLERRGQSLIMKVELEGYDSSNNHREFTATFDFTKAMEQSGSRFEYIAIDKINLQEANWYLHDRPSRNINVNQIRMLKQAIELAQHQKEYEAPVKAVLMNAIEQGGLADTSKASILVDNALATWRCAKPSKDVLSLLDDRKALHTILDQIYTLNFSADEYIDSVRNTLSAEGRELIRLSILANGDFCSYSTPTASEKDDRLVKFDWVLRTVFKKSKQGLKQKSESFKHMLAVNTGETVIFECSNVADYVAPTFPVFTTPEAKREALDIGRGGMATFHKMSDIRANRDEIKKVMSDYLSIREELTFTPGRKTVLEPCIQFVIGNVYKYDAVLSLSLFVKASTFLAWACSSHEDLRKELSQQFGSVYEKGHDRAVEIAKESVNLSDKSLLDIVRLGAFSNADLLGIVSESANPDAYFKSAPGFSFSFSRQLKDENAYLADTDLGMLDSQLGVKIPEAHLPCYVVEGTVNDIPVISIHAYDDTSGRYHRKVYDTLEDAVNNHLERTFIQGDGKSHYDVVQRLQKCEPLTNGKTTALLSFEYVTVSKKKRVKL